MNSLSLTEMLIITNEQQLIQLRRFRASCSTSLRFYYANNLNQNDFTYNLKLNDLNIKLSNKLAYQ